MVQCCPFANAPLRHPIAALMFSEDIEIRFFEEDITGKETWEGRGIFSSTDVHKQFGIAFKTPRYKNPNISTAVEVKVR